MGHLYGSRSALAVCAASALLLTACGGEEKRPADSGGQTTAPAEPGPGGMPEVQDVVKAGGSRLEVVAADWMQVVAGAPWASLAGGLLVRLDPTSGKQTATVQAGSDDTCTAMDTRGHDLYAAVCSLPGAVVRVDGPTAKITHVFKLPGHTVLEEGSIAVDGRHVWVVTADERHALLGVDLHTGRITKTFRISQGVAAARAGLGGLWLTDPDRGVLLRIDPRTGQVLATIRTGAGARFFAVGEGAVWVQNNDAGTVSRVDPATNREVASIKVSALPIDGGDLAVGGGSVWARISDVLVARIDPTTNKVVARYGPGSGSGGVAADETAVWISAHDVNAVFRLPLK